jgi:hypothetical protein
MGDAQDDQRDAEPDQRVGKLETGGDGARACHHRQAHVGVGARMGAVGDECRS